MFEQDMMSIEAAVARNMGDPDWEDLIPLSATGCSRKATIEVERDHAEAEPNIDKFTPDQLHIIRNASAH